MQVIIERYKEEKQKRKTKEPREQYEQNITVRKIKIKVRKRDTWRQHDQKHQGMKNFEKTAKCKCLCQAFLGS